MPVPGVESARRTGTEEEESPGHQTELRLEPELKLSNSGSKAGHQAGKGALGGYRACTGSGAVASWAQLYLWVPETSLPAAGD